MTIEYKDSKRIVGLLSYSSTQQDLTTGTTNAGTNSTIRGFGNQIKSDHAIVGSTLTKVEVSFKTAMTGTATVGVWDSSNNLKLTLGTKDLTTLTGSEAYYTFDTGSVIMEADWIIGFQISGTATNTSVTLRTNGTNADANIDAYNYNSSSGWSLDGTTREYNMKIHYNNGGDEKPTDVQDNSLFVEKDTGKRYWFSEAPAPTFEDDFSGGDNWTDSGSTPSVNTSTDVIDFESATTNNIKAQTTYDLTSTSDTKWVLRCKLNVTTFTQPSTEYHRFFIGLSSSTSNLNTSEDAIGLKYELGAGSLDRLVAIDTNGSTIRATTGDNFTHTSAVETLYVEIIRQSATTYDVNLRSGSHSGTLVEAKTGLTTGSGTTGLRYIKIASYSDHGGNGELSGTIDDVEFYNDVTTPTPATWTWDKQGIRGVFGGGETSTYVNTMDYITMATLGNATDFGNLTASRYNLSSVSSNTRGVFSGGRVSSGSNTNIMDYITIATLGDATDFGDLTSARRLFAGVSSNTRGVFAGGYTSSDVNTMDYITIATLGNAIDFGDLTSARRGAANVSSDVRGIFGGGYTGSNVNTMDYITIATPSNAIDFGDLTVARNSASGVSSDVRGVFGGGQTSTYDATMDYVTIATLGNATDFGDMTVARMYYGAVSSNIRGIFGGGNTGSITNVIDYITIATTGNATDFGDLSESRKALAGVDDRLK